MHRTLAAAAASRLAGFCAPVADILYPPVCLACGARLDERTALVCPSCFRGLTPAASRPDAWRGVTDGLTGSGGADAFVPLFLFERNGTLQELVHLLKYGGFRRIGTGLGRLLGERLAREPSTARPGVAVPVPLHPRRRRVRGYNQSALIAAAAARAAGIRCLEDGLVRTRDTRSQTELGPGERRANVDGAFAAREDFRKMHVLLVDDVATTGATLAAAARALRVSGAARITAAVLGVAC